MLYCVKKEWTKWKKNMQFAISVIRCEPTRHRVVSEYPKVPSAWSQCQMVIIFLFLYDKITGKNFSILDEKDVDCFQN
jgi:hypothetical protein